MYFYIKALHIIFIVTWFSGLFYIVRLFVYKAEANEKTQPERSILLNQFAIMQRRLWFGITWPSAILTLVFGTWMGILYGSLPMWLLVKLFFVLCLFTYHFTLHNIYKQQSKDVYKWTSLQLRLWNEAATVLLIAIVMLAVVKQLLSAAQGVAILITVVVLLFFAIRIYKRIRSKEHQ